MSKKNKLYFICLLVLILTIVNMDFEKNYFFRNATPKNNTLLFNNSKLDNVMLSKWTYGKIKMKYNLIRIKWEKIDKEINSILLEINNKSLLTKEQFNILNNLLNDAVNNDFYVFFSEEFNCDVLLLADKNNNIIYCLRLSDNILTNML